MMERTETNETAEADDLQELLDFYLEQEHTFKMSLDHWKLYWLMFIRMCNFLQDEI